MEYFFDADKPQWAAWFHIFVVTGIIETGSIFRF
jgi:hypothetical protein